MLLKTGIGYLFSLALKWVLLVLTTYANGDIVNRAVTGILEICDGCMKESETDNIHIEYGYVGGPCRPLLNSGYSKHFT